MDWLWIIITVVLGLYLIYWLFLSPAICHSSTTLHGKTVLVTGGNAGIGKATALGFLKRGAKVIIACRNMEKSQMVAQDIANETGFHDKIKIMKLDLGSLKSVREFAEQFKKEENQVNILVNNAGVCKLGCPREFSEDGIEMHLAVNHIGHFLLTNLVLDRLKDCAPSRVVNVSSVVHGVVKGMPFDDINPERTPFTAYKAYCYTKLANVLFTKELAKRLKGTSVTTYALHPGYIKTDIASHHWVIQLPGVDRLLEIIYWLFGGMPYYGSQTSIYCSVAEELSNVSGTYYSNCAEMAPSVAAQDAEAVSHLWEISEKMCGLSTYS